MKTDRQTESERETHTCRETDRQTHRPRVSKRHTHEERQKEKQTDLQRERESETGAERSWVWHVVGAGHGQGREQCHAETLGRGLKWTEGE
jgi:hypothetical protein